MKLNKCLQMIRAEQNTPFDWAIRFYDGNNIAYGENAMIPTTICIADLYDDWYGDCNSCPENGEFVFGIIIAHEPTGRSYLIETPYEYTFEDLMTAIENEFYAAQGGSK